MKATLIEHLFFASLRRIDHTMFALVLVFWPAVLAAALVIAVGFYPGSR